MKTLLCGQCGEKFLQKHFGEKYCSYNCAEAVANEKGRQARLKKLKKQSPHEEIEPTPLLCPFCNTYFIPKSIHQQYCSTKCRSKSESRRQAEKRLMEKPAPILPRPAIGGRPVKEYPRGRYVYGWYHPKLLDIPFYIGQGVYNRAWTKHTLDDGTEAPCETVRTKSTVVKIYRDNLTLEGALLLESVLVDLFRSMGAVLYNQSETLKRRERPPLTK